MTLLEVQDLKTHFLTYGGTVQALDGVNLAIDRNEWLGLVGETGCGKSVTALSILRLVRAPGRIVGGRVLLEGEDLLAKSEKEMREIRGRRVSMIFQDPTSSLNPVLNVGLQVYERPLWHEKLTKSQAIKKAEALFQEVGIPEPISRLKQFPHEFSGGMRQRIMIAIALYCRPELLIADEPTTNLDVTVQAQILKLMKELQHKYESSILLITHNLGVVAATCDRVAVMYAGEVVEVGRVRDIFEAPVHPYTVGLLGAIPRVDVRREWLAVIQGSVPNLVNPPLGCKFHDRCPYADSHCSESKPSLAEVSPSHYVACFKSRDLQWKNQ